MTHSICYAGYEGLVSRDDRLIAPGALVFPTEPVPILRLGGGLLGTAWDFHRIRHGKSAAVVISCLSDVATDDDDTFAFDLRSAEVKSLEYNGHVLLVIWSAHIAGLTVIPKPEWAWS